MTLGEFRAKTAHLPDSTPIEVYSGSVDSFTAFSLDVCTPSADFTEVGYNLDSVSVVLFTEN